MPSAACSYQLDVRQGYNFDKTNNAPCGFVTALKIGDTEFKADQKVCDIENPESEKEVVGVLRDFEWDTSITGPTYFSMQLSPEGKKAAKQLALKDMKKIDVEITFNLFEFDPAEGAQAFFKAVHSNDAPIKGVVLKEGANFVFGIEGVSSPEVQTPENYMFTLGVLAQGKQDMHMAVSQDAKFVKQIGMDLA